MKVNLYSLSSEKSDWAVGAFIKYPKHKQL